MQQSQRSPQTQTPSRTPGRGGGGATGTGTASGATGGGLQQALQLALAGDPSGLRDIAGRDPNFTATIDTMMASQVDQVMVGADTQGAIWGEVMTRASVVEEQRKVLPAGGAVEPVAESVTDTTAALPEAVEINDLGPVLPWGSVMADIEESSPVADNDRVAELLKPELGVDVSAQVVHIDREA